MTLTWKQKALRPVLNFLVERYFPNGAFYGGTFFDAFKEFEDEDGDGKLGQASTLWHIHLMNDLNADHLQVDISDVTLCGKYLGDFKMVATLGDGDDT